MMMDLGPKSLGERNVNFFLIFLFVFFFFCYFGLGSCTFGAAKIRNYYDCYSRIAANSFACQLTINILLPIFLFLNSKFVCAFALN